MRARYMPEGPEKKALVVYAARFLGISDPRRLSEWERGRDAAFEGTAPAVGHQARVSDPARRLPLQVGLTPDQGIAGKVQGSAAAAPGQPGKGEQRRGAAGST